MAEHSSARGGASGQLTTDQGPPPPRPVKLADVGGEEAVPDQFSAVINVHGCNLQQIEAAIAANAHEVDPHPASPGRYLRRHPVYLVAFDPELDEDGNPKPGKPTELDLKLIRQIFSARPDYSFVSPDPPPDDGSHISVEGMHFIAETDSNGQATGRVKLGTPPPAEEDDER